MIKTGFIAACILGVVATAGQAQEWFAEEGQGIRSASITTPDVTLDITCVLTAANVADRVSITFGSARPTAKTSFTFDYDDSTYMELSLTNGEFVADSAAKQQLFDQLIRGLKAGRWVEIYDPVGGEPIVPLSGSGLALAPCG